MDPRTGTHSKGSVDKDSILHREGTQCEKRAKTKANKMGGCLLVSRPFKYYYFWLVLNVPSYIPSIP
jgi:hypothetical protein